MRGVDGVGVWLTLGEVEMIGQGCESFSRFGELGGRLRDGSSVRLQWGELEVVSRELAASAVQWEERLGEDCVSCGWIVRGPRRLAGELRRLSRDHAGSPVPEFWEH